MSVSLLLRFLRDRACLRKILWQRETVQIGFHSNFSTKSNGSTQPRGESRKTTICSKQTLSGLNLFLKYLTLCNLFVAHIITLNRRECFPRIPFLRNSWNIELYCDNIMTYCTLLKEKSIKWVLEGLAPGSKLRCPMLFLIEYWKFTLYSFYLSENGSTDVFLFHRTVVNINWDKIYIIFCKSKIQTH